MTRKQPPVTPGYRIRIEGFIPSNPDDISSIAKAAEQVTAIRVWLDTLPFEEIMTWHKFVARHRTPSLPAPAEAQTLAHHPAGPTEAHPGAAGQGVAVSAKGGDAPSSADGHRPTPDRTTSDAAPVAEAGGGGAAAKRKSASISGEKPEATDQPVSDWPAVYEGLLEAARAERTQGAVHAVRKERAASFLALRDGDRKLYDQLEAAIAAHVKALIGGKR